MFDRLKQYGLRLKESKCSFMQSSVEYLGHIVDEQGLKATTEKVNALANTPQSEYMTELRVLLSLLNNYWEILPNLA